MTKQLLSEILEEAKKFLSNKLSLGISTISASGKPLASYAPFVRDDKGSFYIFVSTLANHTTNLSNGVASVLIIDDEKDTIQIYTRIRLCYQCNVEEISRQHKDFNVFIEMLKNRHGQVVDTLAELADFKLFRLNPDSGRFIKGFGQTYTIDATLTSIEPVVPS